MINDVTKKRLAYIKYLYNIGLVQSKQAEPISSFSILALYDSIEMFLILLAEHRSIKQKLVNEFMNYWIHIPTLTQKESIFNLKEKRNEVKHRGRFLSKLEIETSRVNATDFFEQNTFSHFGIEFKDITLLSLVLNSAVRQKIEDAQKFHVDKDYKNFMFSIADAFHTMIFLYEDSKKQRIDKTPFSFGKNISHFHSFQMKGPRNEHGRQLRLATEVGDDICKFVDTVRDCLEETKKALKIISLGIDYKKYIKYQLLTPTVNYIKDGESVFIGGCEEKYCTEDNCQFCFDFVLDSVLILQEFDFELQELIEKS